MKGDLNRNQHSVYKLTYHLVLVIKYRRKVINQDIFDFLMDIFSDIGDKYGVEIVESNWDVDHIHVLFDAAPSTNLVKFINAYKSASSRSIKRDYPQIKRFLWKSAFWKTGYFITTSGGANIETIKRYIERQREK
ncbi:IS200/IS605 family transposase [Methanobrevibacter sp.]|uniref:IS200/IS605 family transposase n=1 Tax=Methanobrevibacter sp. TaxID=66852 RepID=UPI00388E9155